MFPTLGLADAVSTLGAVSDLHPVYVFGPIGALAALLTAFLFARSVLKTSEGDEEMVRIAQAVREGAMAYLRRQYKVVAIVFVAIVAALGLLYVLGLQPALSMLGVPIAGTLSGLCGWFGMKMATNASARTAHAAKQSLNSGLTIAFRSGAVMGMVVVGFALLDVSVWFLVLNALEVGEDLRVLTTIMLSYGMGASTQALFARVGGGIYTKAADVGADLVGKVEAGIPEDDPRNPATIADNVGDNVGDVAGMGADLYESYYGSMLATMALGAAAAFAIPSLGEHAAGVAMRLALAPIAVAGLGILCSILGVFTVRAREDASFMELLKGLHRGVYAASGLIVLAAFGLLWLLFSPGSGDAAAAAAEAGVRWWGVGLSIVSGLVAGLVIAHATEHYTSYEYEPTRRIALQAITGPATVIIAGIAEGMKSTWASLVTVVVAIIAAFVFAGGSEHLLLGLYGVGIAAVGMLATLGITLATDAYGPIADNAGGNAEMSGQPPFVRERTDMLDSLGNTTAATGKGFAIGSAALTALALFAAYIQVVQAQLTSQAEDFAGDSAFTAPQDATDNSMMAVYQGHHRFAVVRGEGEERTVDAALTLAVAGTHGEEPPLTVRQSYPVEELGEGRYAIRFSHEHDGHNDTVVIEAASSRTGSITDVLNYYNVTFMNPRALGGVFIGVLLAFLFCALTMNAVGRAANAMMQEARRQFAKMREAFRSQGLSDEQIADPGQWPKQVEHEGVRYPDYARCVTISTAGAQREMVVPATLAIVAPILVGLTLGVPGVVGMLAGGLTSGFAVAIFMANAGGAWDNAKKLIESYGKITAQEFLNVVEKREAVPAAIRDEIDRRANECVQAGRPDAIVYGKGSEDHKAAVVGDTVGDPFKDTSGPSLNILIKLISIVSVVFAGLVVKFGPVVASLIGLD